LLLSSLLSLIIGTILGLNESRIKRLFAYSTISHIGFILLSLGINSLESIQAFTFYLIQYSISNLNAFLLLISIGYSLYIYVLRKKDKKDKKNKEKEKDNKAKEENDNEENEDDDLEKNYNVAEKNNSPVQVITQLKGYFFLNPVMAMSLCITIYSFVGIPPLIGFFAKQMVLSAALDNGYIFLSYVAIIVSVISAVYYLNIIKQMFFETSKLEVDKNLVVNLGPKSDLSNIITNKNIIVNSALTITISVITLVISLFFTSPNELLSMTNILSLILFNS